jgi:putative nucleotidyltransferase with HDIG domain
MSRIEELEKDIQSLYHSETTENADWSPWIYENHVVVVADYATELARRYGENEDTARAAGLLHDISDAVMRREDERSEQASLDMATELLKKHGYSDEEIDLIVNDGIRYHGCKDGKIPQFAEGKILATADSMAHLKSDFYVYAIRHFRADLETTKAWALGKIERDYNAKILYDDVRDELKPDYEMLKNLFSR